MTFGSTGSALPASMIALLVAVGGCGGGDGAIDAGQMPGAPLAGLSAAELQRFTTGSAIFAKEFTPAEGLGPLFNEKRCSNCHDLPTLGGTGVENATKVTRFEAGRCDLLADQGGPVVSAHATPLLAALGVSHEQPPKGTTALAVIIPPALYGLGLVETIPEEQILALVRNAPGGGIAGRAARTADGRLARFGRKAEFASVADFVEGAIRGEMGLTTPAHPAEETINGRPLPAGADPASDPEVNRATLDALTDFVRMLAPPAREPHTGASADTLDRGERLFAKIGCSGCHVPSMTTGTSTAPYLNHRLVRLYSDLLLHDMGPRLADICTPSAAPGVWRTAPLMGIRLRQLFLHDGRASLVDDAIRQHDGEARPARNAYQLLDPAERDLLLRFIRSL